jgi:oligopeptide transport system substrate-binding protein
MIFRSDQKLRLIPSRRRYPKEYFNVGQLGTYYLCWNVNKRSNSTHLATPKRRREPSVKALSLLINRQYIIDNVANGADQQPMASSRKA